jgi:hypothetical protein
MSMTNPVRPSIQFSLVAPSSVSLNPMSPAEMLEKGPTPATEFDWLRLVGIPGQGSLQQKKNLTAAAGGFLAYGKHRLPSTNSDNLGCWPTPFRNVVDELNSGFDDAEFHSRLNQYITQKRKNLFDAVSVSNFFCPLPKVTGRLRRTYIPNIAIKSPLLSPSISRGKALLRHFQNTWRPKPTSLPALFPV